jgi:predicted RNA binding protein YcfA (HicA-like mRNA interferase family)
MLKPLSRKELIRRFRVLGFSGPLSGGRHQFMIKGSPKIRIPDPHHGDIDVSLLKEIIRQAGISSTEWEEL